MEFTAGTIRITALDHSRHLAPRPTAVISGAHIRLHTEPNDLASVTAKWDILLPEAHPQQWQDLHVRFTGLQPLVAGPEHIHRLIDKATKTSEAAIEAWSPSPGPHGWSYLVVPSISFETLGACCAIRRDELNFSGRLFPDRWGMVVEPWFVDREADGLHRPFAPAAHVKPGDVWAITTTTAPPPTASPVPDVVPLG